MHFSIPVINMADYLSLKTLKHNRQSNDAYKDYSIIAI